MKNDYGMTTEQFVRWEDWYTSHVLPGLDFKSITLEMLAKFDDDHGNGNDPAYELRGVYTLSGNPELFSG